MRMCCVQSLAPPPPPGACGGVSSSPCTEVYKGPADVDTGAENVDIVYIIMCQQQ